MFILKDVTIDTVCPKHYTLKMLKGDTVALVEDSKVVGLARYVPYCNDAKIAYVNAIEIDKRYRGKGKGAIFVELLKNRLKAEGYISLRGEGVDTSYCFWDKMGCDWVYAPTYIPSLEDLNIFELLL